jgi:ubiquinone/menaquinone biosynthesis C-methylase UbiE
MTKSGSRGHRWFAASYDLVTLWSERRVLRHLRISLVGSATGYILEIGAGTGANFPYYKVGENIVATEPDPFMLRRAQQRAAKLGLAMEFHQCRADALPFPDHTFDTVVSTFVFCSVSDPELALAEVKRVLRPGGTFRFIEHVRADGAHALLQEVLTPVWWQLGAGCHLNRRTAASIQAAGFDIREMQQHRMPLTPLIVGVAGLGS